ncbi:hypothetical protein FRB93_001883, partial [Tulasnella sp. JGI-2019a]
FPMFHPRPVSYWKALQRLSNENARFRHQWLLLRSRQQTTQYRMLSDGGRKEEANSVVSI